MCVCVRVLLSFDLQLLKNYNLSLSVIRIWRKRRKHFVLDMRDAWIGAWLFFLQQITSNTHLEIELKYTIIIYSYLFKANVLSVVYFLAKISFRSRPVNSVFSKARAKTCKSSILLLLLYWYVYNWTISYYNYYNLNQSLKWKVSKLYLGVVLLQWSVTITFLLIA